MQKLSFTNLKKIVLLNEKVLICSMKKIAIILIFLIISLSSGFCFGAIGIEGGFNGYFFDNLSSHNNREYGFLSYKPSRVNGPFDFTFSLGAGSTSYGYSGYSVAVAIDSWGKPLSFGKISTEKMNWIWGYGILFSFGSSYYFLNGDGNQKTYELLPRLILGYRYFFPNKKIELFLMSFFEAGFYYRVIDAHWTEGIIKKGFDKIEYGFDWDIPLQLGFRYWFKGVR
jgi:hypothetical protein